MPGPTSFRRKTDVRLDHRRRLHPPDAFGRQQKGQGASVPRQSSLASVAVANSRIFRNVQSGWLRGFALRPGESNNGGTICEYSSKSVVTAPEYFDGLRARQ